MKHGMTLPTAFALLLALALPSQAARVKELPKQTSTIAGTIETIDQNSRAMSIKTADGTFVAVTAPPSVKRFNELKVGDKVKATYSNTVIVRLKPAGEATVDTVYADNANVQASGLHLVLRTITASIVAIDQSASSISFEAANGWKYSRRVIDPAVFDQVMVGDKVDITWNTDLVVELE